jgi:acetyl-CoA synthetase
MDINIKYNKWQNVVDRHKSEKYPPEEIYQIFRKNYENDEIPVAWLPETEIAGKSNISIALRELNLKNYSELHSLSINDRNRFWDYTIKKTGIKFSEKYKQILPSSFDPKNPDWLQGAKLNIAESCFNADPGSLAIIEKTENAETVKRITVKELDESSSRFAQGLFNSGFSKGDRIVFYLPLSSEAVIAYLGIIKAGLVAVSVADSFSPEELKNRITLTDAKGIVTCDGYWYNGKWLRILDKVNRATEVPAIICHYDTNTTLNLRQQDFKFENLLNASPVKSIPYSSPDGIINILFSSGTTKEPKVIPWTQITPLKCASDGLYHQDIKEGDVVTWTTGMGWMMAPWLIFATLLNRATIALYTGAATSEKFGDFVNEAGISILGTIPSIVKTWKSAGFHKQFNWHKVRLFSSTGEPSNQEDYFYLMYLTDFRAPIIEYCGGTEIGGGYITGTIVQPCSPSTFTTPTLGMDFYLMGPDFKPVPEKISGEVFIIPPSIGLTQKLLNRDNDKEYYEGISSGPKGEVLRKHGDAFETFNSDGIIFYKSIGRTDDAMNLGGIKISAVEIEEIANGHSMVRETAAVSVPESGDGPEKLVLFIVPKDQNITVSELQKELQSMISSRLNPLFRISEVKFLTNLPRTASNKIMRRELRKELMQSGK